MQIQLSRPLPAAIPWAITSITQRPNSPYTLVKFDRGQSAYVYRSRIDVLIPGGALDADDELSQEFIAATGAVPIPWSDRPGVRCLRLV